MKYSRTCMCVLVSLAITSPKRPYIQNNKIFPVKAILVETRVNDHLSKAIGTTFWGDGFIIFHCTCKFDCIFFTSIVNCATIYHIFNFELACESIRFFRLKFLVSWVKLELESKKPGCSRRLTLSLWAKSVTISNETTSAVLSHGAICLVRYF